MAHALTGYSDAAISGCTVLSDIYFRPARQHELQEQYDLTLPTQFLLVKSLAPNCRECELLNLRLGGCRGRAAIENGSILACDSFRKDKIMAFARNILDNANRLR